MPYTDSMFSSKEKAWETPFSLFEKLDREFHFTLDPCCIPQTAKCKKYYTKKEDGLKQSWEGETVFMNPPYGKVDTYVWMRKAYRESKKPNTKVICLIPARTDTEYWHEFCMEANEIRFIQGRVVFGNAASAAPFPSAVVIFDGTDRAIVTSMKYRE